MYNPGGYGAPRPHAGLGMPNAAQNIAPANGYGAPAAGFTGEKYSLFVTNIPESVSDVWLERLFNAAGPLIQIKRIRDANGVPKAFGFAEYSDGESVLRCLQLINNVPLPAGSGQPDKVISVKADDKTRGRLNAFESSKDPSKMDADAEAMEQAQNYLKQILHEMKEAGGADAADAASTNPAARVHPIHLQDLGPEDLPEESRGIITKEIAFFRERAAKKEADRKAAQAEKDRTAGLAAAHFGRSSTSSNNQMQQQPDQGYQLRPQNDQQQPQGHRQANSPPHRDGGYNQGYQRDGYNNQQYHQNDQQQHYQQRQGAFGPRGGRSNAFGNFQHQRGGYQQNQRQWGRQDDSQGYNRPVGFVRAGDEGSPPREHHRDDGRSRGNGYEVNEDDLPDEERERLRQDRKRRDAEHAFRDRERKWEARERTRHSAFDRERMRENALQRDEDALRVSTAQRLDEWDDEKEKERGKELFYVDRTRWRAQRRTFREREMAEDRRDAEVEAAQLEELKKQSDAFLDKQADMFAKMADTKRKTGVSIDDSTPIKLSLAEKVVERKEAVKPVEILKPAAFGPADDAEEVGKKKRELIPLNYSDDEEEDEEEKGMTADEKMERRRKKIKQLVESIPTDQAGVWAWEVRWDKLSESMVSDKITPFIKKKVVEALGTEDDDIVDLCLEHIKAHKPAQGLVDELEPILAEESPDFVMKIWRFLIFEVLAATHRIATTTV